MVNPIIQGLLQQEYRPKTVDPHTNDSNAA